VAYSSDDRQEANGEPLRKQVIQLFDAQDRTGAMS
jgi:hypothetical protein